MKNILGLLKANLVSVILLVVAVVALPTLAILGSGMGSKLRKKVEDDVTKQLRDLQAVKVSYALEPLTPDQQPFTVSIPPNEATNNAMRALLDRTREEFEGVKSWVVSFNQNGKKPLVEGLFPAPESDIAAPERLYAMARAWPAAYEPLLKSVGAGSPPSAEDVARRLEELRLKAVEERTGGRTDAALTEQDVQEITARLADERVQMYLARAASLRLYADPSVFDGVSAWTGQTPPSIDQAWEWQWQHWVHEDILRALAAANGGASLLSGPVKRVERISIDPVAYDKPAAAAAADPTAEVAPDFGASLTGRIGWPDRANPLYDVRNVNLTLVIDAARAPAIINAFSMTNLMTVTDFDLTSIDDLPSHLKSGYVYTRGAERVMRVRMRVETLWLREWTVPLMPRSVQAVVGVPGAAPEGAAPGEDPTGGRRGRPQQQRQERDASEGGSKIR